MFVIHDAPAMAPASLTRASNRNAGASRDERGDTLVEILIAIVVIGIVGSAAFFSISFGATNSNSHRDFVTADQVLRNAAEATKEAVRTSCANGGTTYSVAYSALPAPDPAQTWHQYYEVNRHFTLPSDIANHACPAAAGPLAPQTLSVTLPSGVQKSLKIIVRAP